MDTKTTRRRFLQVGVSATAAMVASPAFAQATDDAFTLPELPYAQNALEPHIDARTMEIHYGKHHAAYVANLNKAVAETEAMVGLSLREICANLRKVDDEAKQATVRNNGGGHWNHTLFWEIMGAPTDSKPEGTLLSAINDSFESFDNFKDAFAKAAATRFGSGWAWLIVKDGKLKIVSTPNQDNPLMMGIVPEEHFGEPILGLDVWEHAYYLHYQNRRADYISAWWSVVNWSNVSARFERAVEGDR